MAQRFLATRTYPDGTVHTSLNVAADEATARQVIENQDAYAHETYGHDLPVVELVPEPIESAAEGSS